MADAVPPKPPLAGSPEPRAKPARRERALVLGGGGVAGVAWTTGLLLGLQEEGVDVLAADLVAGTSAGASVGAQITSGMPLPELFERQVDPNFQVDELAPRIRYLRIVRGVVPALFSLQDTTRFRRRIGQMALKVDDVEPEQRRAVIAHRLPRHEWPETSLTVAAIDAATGELRWLDRVSGATLVDAVGASCAVPGVWPTVRIDGRDYYDGGIPSPDNSERATGYRRVLLVSPMGAKRSGELRKRVREEVEALEQAGARVLALTPDSASREAFGRQVLDPATRTPSARAGLNQGRREAATVLGTWG